MHEIFNISSKINLHRQHLEVGVMACPSHFIIFFWRKMVTFTLRLNEIREEGGKRELELDGDGGRGVRRDIYGVASCL